MCDMKSIYIVAYDSETFLIKKQLDYNDTTSFFVSTRSIYKNVDWNSCTFYLISIPFALMRKMPSIKIGSYVYFHVNENQDIVVTTRFSKKGE